MKKVNPEEIAKRFVNRYPAMFTDNESKWFWEQEVEKLNS